MNSSLSSVLKGSFVLLLLAGCGPKDGVKEFEQAKDAYGVRDLAKADKLFEKSLTFAPNDVDRLMYLARVKLDLGELAAAKDLVSRAALNADDDADVGMLAAQIAWHAKDYKTASGGFTALANDAKLDPSVRAQAWAGLGIVEMTCDDYHLARICFLRAIRLDRRNAAAWYHLGLIYRELGYLEAALEQFDIFVRLDAMSSPRVQKVQKNVIPALKEAIAQATADRPGVSKRNASACSTAIGQAEAALKKGKTNEAIRNYQTALAADPLSYPAALGLAKLLERATDKDSLSKALEAYRTACAVRPSAVSTFVTAGALAYRLGYYSQAAEIYSRAVAASPTSFDALDGLIRSLRKVGSKAKTAQAYQSYRDSIPVKKK